MNRISFPVLRACFRTFLGEKDYKKFLAAGVSTELRYWQERAWEKFISKYPEMNVTPIERSEAFNLCPQHEIPLLLGFIDSPDGDYAPANTELFPMAPLMPLLNIGVHQVKYCHQCISEKALFNQRKINRD